MKKCYVRATLTAAASVPVIALNVGMNNVVVDADPVVPHSTHEVSLFCMVFGEAAPGACSILGWGQSMS